MWSVILSSHQHLSGDLRGKFSVLRGAFAWHNLVENKERKRILHPPKYTTNRYHPHVLSRDCGRDCRQGVGGGSAHRNKMQWHRLDMCYHLTLQITRANGVFMTWIQMSKLRIQDANVTQVQKFLPHRRSHSSRCAGEPHNFPWSPAPTLTTGLTVEICKTSTRKWRWKKKICLFHDYFYNKYLIFHYTLRKKTDSMVIVSICLQMHFILCSLSPPKKQD